MAYLRDWALARGHETHTDAGNVMVRIPGQDPTRALVLHAHMDVGPPETSRPGPIHPTSRWCGMAGCTARVPVTTRP